MKKKMEIDGCCPREEHDCARGQGSAVMEDLVGSRWRMKGPWWRQCREEMMGAAV